uniref:ERVV2 protein n=1 Tax=Gallus gallus TaxID=9031 RepID=A0A8V0Y947_CHICK
IWGITDLQNTILNISKALEDIENATRDAITAVQTEVNSLSKVILQNRMALDLQTAKEGGVCMIVSQFCPYVDKIHRVEKVLQTIWEKKSQVVHQVTQSWEGTEPEQLT